MAPIYVQYGCGFSVGKDWLNFDSSPTLRVERLPIIGPALGRMAGNSQRFPGLVKYGDICIGLPVSADSARGAYASHVLEHLSYTDLGTVPPMNRQLSRLQCSYGWVDVNGAEVAP